MQFVQPQHFLAWAREHGIGPDTRYSEPRCLIYVPDRPHSRFWEVPESTLQIPLFISHLLDGMDAWSFCYLWPKAGWLDNRKSADPRDQVYGAILEAAGITGNAIGAARFDKSEKGLLISVIFAAISLGWSVKDDFFVIPDHGLQFLESDHHGVVHVNYAQEHMIDPFIKHMATRKFLLPDEMPDETFKQPDWVE